MKSLFLSIAGLLLALAASLTLAAEPPLKFGVGLFQPDRDKNDATYRPLAAYFHAVKLNAANRAKNTSPAPAGLVQGA